MTNCVVIPTYNEAKNIKHVIELIFSVLPSARIIVVDDNSPDKTGQQVLELKNKFPNLSLFSRQSKEGLGAAYKDALQAILANNNFDNLVIMDGDGSHNPLDIPRLLEISAEHDLVIGSRYIKGGGIESWELWRRALSRFGNLYCRAILRTPVNDWTSGFNLIKAVKLREIDLNSFDASGYAFLIELKYALIKEGARFKEVPIIFRNRRDGETKISNDIIGEGIKAPWKMITKKL